MNLDYWSSLRPSLKVKRDRSRITIPAFSAVCGEQSNKSLEISGDAGYRLASEFAVHINSADDPFEAAAWQVDMWVKPLEYIDAIDTSVANRDTRIFSYGTEGSSGEDMQVIMVISGEDHKFKVNIKNNTGPDGTVYTFVVDKVVSLNEWHHVGLKYDNATNPGTPIVSVFMDGQLVRTEQAAVATLRSVTPKYAYIGSPRTDGSTTTAPFLIDELRIWLLADGSTPILLPDWYFYENAPHAARFIDAETDTGSLWANGEWGYLYAYYKFNSATAPWASTNAEAPSFSVSISNGANGDSVASNAEGYPNAWSSRSHIAAQVPLAVIAKNFSLKYPCSQPAGANFSATVAWIDDNDEVQRRTLWDTGLAEPSPLPYANYRGERINYANAYIEFWQDYGVATITLAADLTLEISPLVSPTDEAPTRPTPTSISSTDNLYATANLSSGEAFNNDPAI